MSYLRREKRWLRSRKERRSFSWRWRDWPERRAETAKLLKAIGGCWTSRRVADRIERELGVRYHPGHVWRILVRLGWNCQRPEGRARERNEEAIRHWQKLRWPAHSVRGFISGAFVKKMGLKVESKEREDGEAPTL